MFEIFLELTISVGMKSSFNLYHLMHTAQSNQYWGLGGLGCGWYNHKYFKILRKADIFVIF